MPPATPSAPYEVACSTTTSAWIDWPSTVRVTPVAENRTYGPAGSTRLTVPAPTVRVSSTAVAVVFTCSDTVA